MYWSNKYFSFSVNFFVGLAIINKSNSLICSSILAGEFDKESSVKGAM